MRIYRNHYTSHGGESEGFEFFTSEREARKAAADYRRDRRGDDLIDVETTFSEVSLTKGGLLRILNAWASHPDNGQTTMARDVTAIGGEGG